jgi:hypothetical protein
MLEECAAAHLAWAKRARRILWFTDILAWMMMMIVSFGRDDRRFDRNDD